MPSIQLRGASMCARLVLSVYPTSESPLTTSCRAISGRNNGKLWTTITSEAPRRMSAVRPFCGYGKVQRSEPPLDDRTEPIMFNYVLLPKHGLAQKCSRVTPILGSGFVKLRATLTLREDII
jgi:hypothetical protein